MSSRLRPALRMFAIVAVIISAILVQTVYSDKQDWSWPGRKPTCFYRETDSNSLDVTLYVPMKADLCDQFWSALSTYLSHVARPDNPSFQRGAFSEETCKIKVMTASLDQVDPLHCFISGVEDSLKECVSGVSFPCFPLLFHRCVIVE